MKGFTLFPWDLSAWKLALNLSGIPGVAMLLLLLAGMVQIPEDSAISGMHASPVTIWFIRAPLTFAAGLLVLSGRSFSKLNWNDLRFWFLIYAILFAASVLWSTSPAGTAGKALELLIAILIILQASRDERALQRLDGLARLVILLVSSVALVSVLGYFARLPGFVYAKVGLITHTTAESPGLSTDSLGYLSISFLLASFAEWQFSGLTLKRFIPKLLYSSFLFLFSSSRTALGICLIGMALLLLRRSKAMLFVFCLASGAVAYFYAAKILKYLSFNESQSSVDTLSGRTLMWIAAIREWRRRPWMGYGGGVGGKYVISRIEISSLAKMSHLHNGFLECLTGLGIGGFILGLTLLTIATIRMMKLWTRYPFFAPLYVWVVIFWIQSIMSMGLLGWMNYLIAIYLVVLAHIDLLRRQERGFKSTLCSAPGVPSKAGNLACV